MPSNPRLSSRVFPAGDRHVLRVVGDVLGRRLHEAARDLLLARRVGAEEFWMRRGSGGRLFVVFMKVGDAARFQNRLFYLAYGVVGFVPV